MSENNNEIFSFEQLQGIMRGDRQVDIINYPGTEKKIGIRVLTQHEIDRCWYDAELKFSKDSNYHGKNFRDTITFAKELERQQLYRAIVRAPESSETPISRFFPDPESVGLVSQDIIALLLSKYNETQDRYNPVAGIKEEADLERLYEEVKKNSAIGLYLSTLDLVTLVDFMVRKLDKLQKDNGSSSVQQNPEKTNLKKSISRARVEVEKVE